MLTKEQILTTPRYEEREIKLLSGSVKIRILTGAERREWADIITSGEDIANGIERQQTFQAWLITRTVCGDDGVLFEADELLDLPSDIIDALFEEAADVNSLMPKRIVEEAENSDTGPIESSATN